MMRIMGLDYGTKTVGVAVSDPLGITAQAVETVTRKDENKLRKTLARIESLATEYGVEKFVIGFPKHMNNDIGERAEKALEIVYNALVEKGYNPVNQIVGYIMSGDPTYITSYNGARSLVMKVERDEIVEELLKAYIRHEL